jgi:Flp pilus assembly protein TadD
MSELEEEIIIIEDSDAADVKHDSENQVLDIDDESQKKKKILIFGAIAISLVLIIVITTLILLKPSPKDTTPNIDYIEEKLDSDIEIKVEPSQLENMIAKANYLYSSGSKNEALNLYEQIAQYSEAISLYNLGVAQLKNEQYDIALETFKKAIINDEKRCVSAINAAVCSLHLKDENSFRYYIDLAHAYLPKEINSPLYSYYHTLISYYNKNYLEALSSLKNSSSTEYPSVQKNLSAKINALYGNNYSAIESMEKYIEDADDFSIALLYARVGDFTLAINHLNEAIMKNIQPAKAQLALGLIYLKAGRIRSAGTEIKNVTDMFPEEVYKHYPIKVKLKDSIFDAKKAQKAYRQKVENSKILVYQKLFYFSPYKVYNAKQTISYIRKGAANIYIDNVASAKQYLKKSASSSSVNYGITKAIKKALSFKIREANEELKQLVTIQPKHSILHYNLALTYAQMGNLILANKHFLRSYHLNSKNYLSGVYAVMTGELINKDISKLKSILKDSISNEDESEEKELYQTLLYMQENNYISAIEWLDNNYAQRPLYLAMDILIASKLNKMKIAQHSATQLTLLLPRDILPHMMYIDSFFADFTTTKYAAEVIKYLKKQDLSFQDLYYGPYLSRYLYIQESLITGQLYFLRQQLTKVLQSTDSYTQEITSALAIASLYDKQFEKSYTLYNTLIDEEKVRDAYTLFLGAIASTAAGHHENAIALLELSKMKDTNFYASRYALGLLYLEIKNNEGATIQFSYIDNDTFISDYFDFEINLDELLFKKQHKKED